MTSANGTRGLTIREWMQGHFSRQVADRLPPREQMERYFRGERLGREENSPLTYDLKITIDDLDRYLADPTHRARLDGEIGAPTLSSARLRAENGTFHLFVPDPEDPETTLLTYHLPLEDPASGRRYYFEGFKITRGGPVRLYRGPWADTALMYFTLHDGATTAAPVLGTGIIRMRLPQFLRLVASTRTRGAPGPASATSATLRFWSWFTRQLYGVYGWRFIFPGWKKRHAGQV